MPRYEEVKWDQAACAGMPTNLFYIFEEHRAPKQFFNSSIVKKVCYACPIWKSCLVYAMRHETVGIWGGLTTHERNAVITGAPHNILNKVRRELVDNGLTEKDLREVMYEYSSDE